VNEADRAFVATYREALRAMRAFLVASPFRAMESAVQRSRSLTRAVRLFATVAMSTETDSRQAISMLQAGGTIAQKGDATVEPMRAFANAA
jgi:hypothetical protein